MKKPSLSAIVVLLVIAILGGYQLWLHSFNTQPAPTQTEFPSTETRLFGRISQVNTSNGKNIIKIDLLNNIEGQQNMEDAAVADGVCTLDQVQKSECLNNPFYIQQTGKTAELELDPQATIQLYARKGSDGMLVNKEGSIYLEEISVASFMQQYAEGSSSGSLHEIPFYFGIEKGRIVQIQEKYTP